MKTNKRIKSSLDYFGTYLQKYLRDTGDTRHVDNQFIRDRADKAAVRWEQARHDGIDPIGAMRLAIKTLTEEL